MGAWDLPKDPLEALRGGDSRPFEAFVRSHARLLVAWFRRHGAGLHRAEDLTQDVLLKLHRIAPRYEAQERFGSYCLRVARNLWIDDCRRRGVRPTTLSLDDSGSDAGSSSGASSNSSLANHLDPVNVRRGPSAPPLPPRQAEATEAERCLQQAIEELSSPHREVFELAVIEGLPYPDIAGLLDIPLGTVKSRVYYAMRKLRDAMAGFELDEGGER